MTATASTALIVMPVSSPTKACGASVETLPVMAEATMSRMPAAPMMTVRMV